MLRKAKDARHAVKSNPPNKIPQFLYRDGPGKQRWLNGAKLFFARKPVFTIMYAKVSQRVTL